MDLYIVDQDKEVLLVGEATFSFSLSLSKYINPARITATCYESRDELEKRHGRELIGSQLSKLVRLGYKSIRFQIDATRLDEQQFADQTDKFARIYFMFPHVSGRSNLRKNRTLMHSFFASARSVLKKPDGDIVIALAAGQGGTSFEKDASKRCNRDSWTINNLAQQNGFILTACQPFQPDLFEHYRSTGFRNQSKSFSTLDSLVHKFELSLPIDLETNEDEFSKFRLNQDHPCIQLRDILVRYFSPVSNLLITDNIKKEDLSPTHLNILGCLTKIDESNIQPSREDVYELVDLKYKIILYQKNMSLAQSQAYLNQLKLFFEKSPNFVTNEHENQMRVYSTNSLLIASISHTVDGFECVIDANSFLKVLFDLDDVRLLFSTDPRTTLIRPVSDCPYEFTHICKAFCIETCKWEHDISFWCGDDGFDFSLFIATIRQTCRGLVRFVRLVDDQYIDSSNRRRSYCFRLVYESCDRALDWETSKLLQARLRENLELKNGLVMR